MRHLVLVRHAQSEWNHERRIQGQSGSGLSATGLAQAGLVGAWLAETYPDARLVSSDLQRCLETAAPFAERLGHEAVPDPGVRERDFGAWSGLLLDEVTARYPQLWTRWRNGEDVVAEVGGESSEDLTTRVTAAYHRILGEAPDGGVVVVVTHGGPVWHGTHALLGLPAGVLGGVANTSVTELASPAPGSFVLSAWNQVGHLPPELRSWFRPADGRATERQAPAVGR